MPSPFYNTGARYGIRALLGTTNISDIDVGMQAMRDDVENAITGYKSGTQAARLAATPLDGLLWRETDAAGIYLGNGVGWTALGASWKSSTPVMKAGATTFTPGVGGVLSFEHHDIGTHHNFTLELLPAASWSPPAGALTFGFQIEKTSTELLVGTALLIKSGGNTYAGVVTMVSGTLTANVLLPSGLTDHAALSALSANQLANGDQLYLHGSYESV